MKFAIIFLTVLTVISVCVNAQDNNSLENEKVSLKQADIDFSNYSVLHGAKDAFLKYAAEEGVMLRRFSMPVAGLDKIKELFSDDEGGYQLTWEPVFADIAASGEIGYTYGLWKMEGKDEKGEAFTRKGNYVTIWKKDSNGNWKFVLDTGNLGLEPPPK